jgi:endonuclease III
MTKTPEDTERALRRKLPTPHWVTFNDFPVPYEQNLFQPVLPFCSQYKLIKCYDQVGKEVETSGDL